MHCVILGNLTKHLGHLQEKFNKKEGNNGEEEDFLNVFSFVKTIIGEFIIEYNLKNM